MGLLRILTISLGLILASPALAEGGSRAVESGWILADAVTETMVRHGFKGMTHGEWSDKRKPAGDILLSAIPYTNLYGGTGRSTFRVLSARRGLEIGLVLKHQMDGGSTDTKLPYFYLNAIEAMPERTVFIIIDGGGQRSEGIAWLRRAVAERRYGMPPDKEVRVMTLGEFRSWAKGL